MAYGVVLPQNEIGNDPAQIKHFAQAAESLGFDHLICYDHILGAHPERPEWQDGPRPYTHEHAFHEVFVLFGYLAAVTERIELASGILVLPQRQAALAAKQAAEVDLLSKGRMRLGVGVGWNDAEFNALGEHFGNRGRRIEEQVHVIQQLWQKPLVQFSGEFHTLSNVGINPLPLRKIPIWMGGGSGAVLRRMARLAQGWFMHDGPIEKVRAIIQKLHGYLRAEGRTVDEFGIDVRLSPRVPEADWPNWLAERRDAGVTDFSVAVEGAGDGSVNAHLALMKRFMAFVS